MGEQGPQASMRALRSTRLLFFALLVAMTLVLVVMLFLLPGKNGPRLGTIAVAALWVFAIPAELTYRRRRRWEHQNGDR